VKLEGRLKTLRGKKPTLDQRKFLIKRGIKGDDWLVQKNAVDFIQVCNRVTGEVRIIKRNF